MITHWKKQRFVLLGVALGLGGCAHSAQQQEILRLSQHVDALQGRLKNHEQRLEELSHRTILLLENRKKIASEANGQTPPELTIVRLTPPSATENETPVATSPPVDLTVYGDRTLARGREPTKHTKKKNTSHQHPTAALPSVAHTSSESAKKILNQGLEAFRMGQTQVALGHFTDFLKQHGSTTDADKAQFWRGETLLELRRYDDAIGAFEEVPKRYPKSTKAPEALLKIGLIYERLGRNHDANQRFAMLVKNYPQSALAELARGRILAAGERP
ncbi:MAG: tol-pal system protein YbgF [Myxococcota bacterium]